MQTFVGYHLLSTHTKWINKWYNSGCGLLLIGWYHCILFTSDADYFVHFGIVQYISLINFPYTNTTSNAIVFENPFMDLEQFSTTMALVHVVL